MKSYSYSLKLIVFCCVSTLFSHSASAQNPKLDSLKNVLLHSTNQDTSKANVFISICNEVMKGTEYKKTLQLYSSQLLTLSYKLGFKKGIATSLLFNSMAAPTNSDLKKEIQGVTEALRLMKEINNKAGIALCYQEFGRISRLQNNFDEAVTYFLTSAKIREEIHDASGATSCYLKVGGIYQHSGNYEKSLQYYFRSLRIAESVKDKNRICENYICIGIVSFEQNKPKQTIEYMNKALEAGGKEISKINLCYIYNNLAIGYSKFDKKKGLEYQIKALNTEKEIGDKIGMAMSYGNIGAIYQEQKKIDAAIDSYLKAIALSEGTNDLSGLCYFYNGAGSAYQGKKNYATAYSYFQKALNTSKTLDFKINIRDTYFNLSGLSEEQKNFKEALEYHRLYAATNDSILNEESLKQSNELNVRYETEKKEKEILLLTKDQELTDKTIKEQRLVRIGLISGLGLLFALSFLLYNRYRLKQKANSILEKQKAEIHQKNILITDSIDYAKTIQEAILPDQEKLSDHLSDYFILYKPKAIVSGDFYWVGKKGNETICVVADCTGHGVPGAFMSLLGHNMLENVIQLESSVNPGAILSALNKEITARFSKGQEIAKHGMDIAVISINRDTQQLQYAGARNSIYLVRQQVLVEIKADKFSTGMILKDHSIPSYANQVISLEKEDMIYLFSDGYPDQKGGTEKKKFYYSPFKELLTGIQRLSLLEQQQRLDQVIMNWMGPGEQIDDILVMGIRYQ